MMRHHLVAAMVVGLAAAAPLAARAAGPFDGTWVIDIPAENPRGTQSSGTCPALRLHATISNSQIFASLQHVASPVPNTIENGTGSSAAPLTGTVQPDGTVAADWQGYHAAGKLDGGMGMVTVKGQCGPREATVIRVAE